ncbi:MAG: EutP/PduV family microcompartment system protein [Clostridia bacterium]|nr:EutP/PduV family microcompartment system protein [Clostridia bacterium]
MKKIMLIGHIACGKTTLCQRLNGLKQEYKKTQTIEVINHTIDTPGEYLEHRALLRSLTVTSVDVDVALFLQDATSERFLFSPGQSMAFPIPVIGVVTKTDIATPEQTAQAVELLELAGAERIFCVSSINGDGMDELIQYLSE